MESSSNVLLIIALVLVALVLYWIVARRADSLGDDSAAMPPAARRTLTVYLLTVGTALVYLLLKLYSVDFPDAPITMEALAESSCELRPPQATGQNQPPSSSERGGTPSQPQSGKPATPQPGSGSGTTAGTSPPAGGVSGQTGATPPQGTPPAAGTGSSTPDTGAAVLICIIPSAALGSSPNVSLALYGRNFRETSRVRFNLQERDTGYRDVNLITVSPRPSDLLGRGSVMVDVVTPGVGTSNALPVSIARPRAQLSLLTRKLEITREVQLLLLVMAGGALGSYVHALKSLADFIGNRTLLASWFWFYITRPFLGMVMAIIFYAVLRGGFLTGTPADVRAVNPFGAIAVAALVGMFSDKAAQKLAEIFDILFKAEDQRGGKLVGPVIDKVEPAIVRPGATPPPELKIAGDRLGRVASVRLNADERKPDTVSEKLVTVMLRPADVAATGPIKVTTVNPDGTASNALTVHVSDLDITTNALPDALAGTPYTATLSATASPPDVTWSRVSGPDWLQVSPQGVISGKPKSAEAANVVVQVTAKSGAAVTKSLQIKVT